jgi:hypothetical protein
MFAKRLTCEAIISRNSYQKLTIKLIINDLLRKKNYLTFVYRFEDGLKRGMTRATNFPAE